jgi:thiol-disulfide isomerase/thioredoxin
VNRAAIAACLVLALGACAVGPAPKTAAAPAHPEARVYEVKPDAGGDVDAALARASANGKRVLLVMGANWCHDSRALAGWLETPRFTALVAEHYELVFVNVGMPQSGDGHNLDIARRFGLNEFPGTPAVLVLTADGTLVNPDTAASWRNAASRSEDAIIAELTALAEAAPPVAN